MVLVMMKMMMMVMSCIRWMTDKVVLILVLSRVFQKILLPKKFSIKDFFKKCHQIHSFLILSIYLFRFNN